MKNIGIFASVMLLFGGCTQMIAVGETKTYCEAHGKDYSDAGYCLSPIEIYKRRHSLDAQNKAREGV